MHTSFLKTHKELWLLLATAALTLIALVGHFIYPFTPDRAQAILSVLGMHAHVGGNVFADTRLWLGIPNAMDVLSNLPFAIFGACGIYQLNGTAMTLSQARLLQCFFSGLLLTTLGSMAYHLSPSNDTLLWDRAGMTVAFAGVMGLAASERVSERAGLWLAICTLTAAALALWVWKSTGDVLPWSVVQFGGMLIVVVLASFSSRTGSLGISLVALIAFYGLAKVLESTDHTVFDATGQWLSGHSLKHVVASLAALPLLKVCRQSI